MNFYHTAISFHKILMEFQPFRIEKLTQVSYITLISLDP